MGRLHRRRVSTEAARTAIDQLKHRRHEVLDEEVDGESPAEVLAWLRAHPAGRAGYDHAGEARDAAVLVGRLRTVADDYEDWIVRRGRDVGLTWARLAAVLGLGSRQAAQAVADRAAAARDGHPRNEKAAQAARATARDEAQALTAWYDRHATALPGVVADLAAAAAAGRIAIGDDAYLDADGLAALADTAAAPAPAAKRQAISAAARHARDLRLALPDLTATSPDAKRLLARARGVVASLP